jgi:hypothetical protein
LDDDVYKYESAGDWKKAGALVRKWRRRFEQLWPGGLRNFCLEELERRHILLFHQEYIPVCIRNWALGKSVEELRVKDFSNS